MSFECERHKTAARLIEAEWPGVKVRLEGIRDEPSHGFEATNVWVSVGSTTYHPCKIHMTIGHDGSIPKDMWPFIKHHVERVRKSL